MLRLLLRGHEIKSIARELSISITAVNERLRSARLKLGVSSSREAARVLRAAENPNLSVDNNSEVPLGPNRNHPRRIVLLWIGVVMAFGIATGIALMALFGNSTGGAPKVVRTSPASGALVAPGPLKLSVTFDRAMRPDNFSFVQKDPTTFPSCAQNMPLQSKDGRTFTLSCTVEPLRSYEVWLNSQPYMNFKALDGTPATPFQLRFRTKGR